MSHVTCPCGFPSYLFPSGLRLTEQSLSGVLPLSWKKEKKIVNQSLIRKACAQISFTVLPTPFPCLRAIWTVLYNPPSEKHTTVKGTECGGMVIQFHTMLKTLMFILEAMESVE